MGEQMIRDMVKGQDHQRSVLIIDRRVDERENAEPGDKCFLYRPSDKLESCTFEQDPSKFLPESLLINSRQCLIPGLNAKDKPISTMSIDTNPGFLALQFHVYSAN